MLFSHFARKKDECEKEGGSTEVTYGEEKNPQLPGSKKWPQGLEGPYESLPGELTEISGWWLGVRDEQELPCRGRGRWKEACGSTR